jgi:hypothetical protein
MLSRVWATETQVWIGNWIFNNLQFVTINNYYTLADLHNLQSLHTNLLSLFPLAFTIRFLATDL